MRNILGGMTTDAVTGQATRSLSESVSDEICAQLGRRRMSQAKLARSLRVSPTWVSLRLSGRQEIGLNDLGRIADAVGMSASQIVAAATNTKADTIGYPGDDEITHSEPHLLTKSHLMRPRRPVRLTPRAA